MNKISSIALLVICILSVPSFGQETTEIDFTTKHELSIVLDDIFANSVTVTPPYYMYDIPTIPQSPKIGLGYKFHYTNSAIRSKISFGLIDYLSDDIDAHRKNKVSSTSISLFFGYEFHKNFKKVQFFYGSDVFINHRKSSNKETDYHIFPNFIDEYIDTSTSYGFSPLLGIKFLLSPMVSVSTELKFIIESYKSKVSYQYRDMEEEISNISGLNTNYGPLGQLSINIHL